MTDANQNDLIAEIARNIVTQIAPQELPAAFQSHERSVFSRSAQAA
jgi:hypothetical protein